MRRSISALVVLATTALMATAWPAVASAAGGSLKLTAVLSGYSSPVLVTHAPGEAGVVYIVEQSGLIKRATLQDGSWRKQGTFLDLRSVVSKDGGERGLLGLAFHPRYRQNGRLYVDYTRAGNGAADGDTVIAEYRRLDARRADPSSRRVLLTVDQPAANHNGGHLAFGPDGYLYIALGDGGGAGDPYGTGQDRGSLLGKLLRIDPLDPDGGGRRPLLRPRLEPAGGQGRPRRDLGLGPAQSVALLLRPSHGRPVDRRCRPGRARGGGPLTRRWGGQERGQRRQLSAGVAARAVDGTRERTAAASSARCRSMTTPTGRAVAP